MQQQNISISNSDQQIQQMISQMAAFASTVSTLQTQLSTANAPSAGCGGCGRGTDWGCGRAGCSSSDLSHNYFQTHGSCAHCSAKRDFPDDCHKIDATYSDIQGVSTDR